MEISQLVSFFHAARLCSISKASEVVFRSQPAVSQQIKALEDEIGCALFHRIGKRKLILTEEGERLHRFAEHLMDDIDNTLDDIRAIQGGSRGLVSVSAPFTTCFQVFPAVLERLLDRYPNIHVSIFDTPQDAAVAMVRNGEADIAVVLETAVPVKFHMIKWKRVVPVLMVPSGHALSGRKDISIHEISKQKLIVPPARTRHPGWSLLKTSALKAGKKISGVIESSNVELSSRLVEKGLGISFATIVEGIPLLEGRNIDFLPLDHLLPCNSMVLAMRNKNIVRGARARFIEALLEC